jgi:hypothetical protein
VSRVSREDARGDSAKTVPGLRQVDRVFLRALSERVSIMSAIAIMTAANVVLFIANAVTFALITLTLDRDRRSQSGKKNPDIEQVAQRVLATVALHHDITFTELRFRLRCSTRELEGALDYLIRERRVATVLHGSRPGAGVRHFRVTS